MQNDEIMVAMSQQKLSETLKRLLFEKNIKPTELARLTKVPQPTIQRIIAGTTARPHSNSLVPIADYFKISINQLKGAEPIDWLDKVEAKHSGINQVPLLDWTEVLSWHQQRLEVDRHKKIFTDAKVSSLGYSLEVKDSSMEPIFPAGTILVIDAKKPAKDRNYIIAALSKQEEVVFRQLLQNAEDYYIRPLSPDLEQFPISHIGENDQILGVLAQAKHNFDEN